MKQDLFSSDIPLEGVGQLISSLIKVLGNLYQSKYNKIPLLRYFQMLEAAQTFRFLLSITSNHTLTRKLKGSIFLELNS